LQEYNNKLAIEMQNKRLKTEHLDQEDNPVPVNLSVDQFSGKVSDMIQVLAKVEREGTETRPDSDAEGTVETAAEAPVESSPSGEGALFPCVQAPSALHSQVRDRQEEASSSDQGASLGPVTSSPQVSVSSSSALIAT
jgi:hypothetical protein